MTEPLHNDEVMLLRRGDGFHEFIASDHYVKKSNKSWFKGSIRGVEAILFETRGESPVIYVALTSKTTYSIEDQLQNNGWASVVVNIILNPTDDFNDLRVADHTAIGHTFLVPVGFD